MDFWEFMWSSLIVLFYVGLVFMWFFAAFDLFARSDLSGWGKVLWLFAIILVPFLGVLLYYIFRPVSAQWWGAHDTDYAYIARDQQMAEIENLSRMRSQGMISDEEYDQIKRRVMTETPATGVPGSTGTPATGPV
ncbi:MAG: hypothetical protein GEU75_11720 [Dehalococcoidia bacterium]|nr:hypothetical protein [Dehalococcoidia bacterium]